MYGYEPRACLLLAGDQVDVGAGKVFALGRIQGESWGLRNDESSFRVNFKSSSGQIKSSRVKFKSSQVESSQVESSSSRVKFRSSSGQIKSSRVKSSSSRVKSEIVQRSRYFFDSIQHAISVLRNHRGNGESARLDDLREGLTVGHEQSFSIGPRSALNRLCFSCRFPSSERATPKRAVRGG